MNLLRSKEATLAVLIIALAAQIPHASYVFTHIGMQTESWFSFLHGGAYAIALELAVLLFVVRNRQIESYGFAGVSIAINLCYYAMHSVSPFSLVAFPAWLVSVALPVAIACYSHDIAHEVDAPALRTIDVQVKKPVRAIAQRNEQKLNMQDAQIEQVIAPTVEHANSVTVTVIAPRNEREHEFWNMLNEQVQYQITALAKEWNVAPNTLRNWRQRWESAQNVQSATSAMQGAD